MRIGNYEITNDNLQWVVQGYIKVEDKDTGLEVEKLGGTKSYFCSLKNVAKKIDDDRLKRIWNQGNRIEDVEAALKIKLA